MPNPLLKARPTKRSILSVIARLFDPMSWVSPVIVTPKILMQDIWRCKLNWDDKLSNNLSKRWHAFIEQLLGLFGLRISRWVKTDSSQLSDLHGFAEAAYAAVVYIKIIDTTRP